jgi:hypothetical protein
MGGLWAEVRVHCCAGAVHACLCTSGCKAHDLHTRRPAAWLWSADASSRDRSAARECVTKVKNGNRTIPELRSSLPGGTFCEMRNVTLSPATFAITDAADSVTCKVPERCYTNRSFLVIGRLAGEWHLNKKQWHTQRPVTLLSC